MFYFIILIFTFIIQILKKRYLCILQQKQFLYANVSKTIPIKNKYLKDYKKI